MTTAQVLQKSPELSPLDRFKRRLQTVVDGHVFETINPFSGQCEGREMKGIECSQ